MASPTGIDILNALAYVENSILHKKIQELIKSNNIFFQGVTITHSSWAGVDFFSKSTEIEPYYVYRYTKEGCKNIACHPLYGKGTRCPFNFEKIQRIDNYGTTIEACQPSCFQSLEGQDREKLNNPFPDTFWIGQECVIINRILKNFCLHPNWRGKVYTNDPPFEYLEEEQDCKINGHYCKHYHTYFDPITEDCERSVLQRIFEDYIWGKTITRFPLDQKIGEFFRHGSRGRRSTDIAGNATQISVEFSVPHLTKLTNHIYQNFITKLGYIPTVSSGSIKLAMQGLKVVALFQSRRLAGIAGLRIFGAITQIVIRHLLGITIRSIAACLSALSVVGLPLFVVGATGIVLDIIDPERYNLQIGKREMYQYLNEFRKTYYNWTAEGKKLILITPDDVFRLLDKSLQDDMDSTVSQQILALEYLSSLKFNSRGQKLDWTDDFNQEDILKELNEFELADVNRIDFFQGASEHSIPFNKFIFLLVLTVLFGVCGLYRGNIPFLLSNLIILTMHLLSVNMCQNLKHIYKI